MDNKKRKKAETLKDNRATKLRASLSSTAPRLAAVTDNAGSRHAVSPRSSSIALRPAVLSTLTAGSSRAPAFVAASIAGQPQTTASPPPDVAEQSRRTASHPPDIAEPSRRPASPHTTTAGPSRTPALLAAAVFPNSTDYVMIPRAVYDSHVLELRRLGIYEGMAAPPPRHGDHPAGIVQESPDLTGVPNSLNQEYATNAHVVGSGVDFVHSEEKKET